MAYVRRKSLTYLPKQ